MTRFNLCKVQQKENNRKQICFLNLSRLNLQTKPVDPTVEGGAQMQQIVNIECISDFMEAPALNIQFRYSCLTLSIVFHLSAFLEEYSSSRGI